MVQLKKLHKIKFQVVEEHGEPRIHVNKWSMFTLKGTVTKCIFRSKYNKANVKLAIAPEDYTKLQVLAKDVEAWLVANRHKLSPKWQKAVEGMSSIEVPWKRNTVSLSRNLGNDFSFYKRSGVKGAYIYERVGGKRGTWDGASIKMGSTIMICAVPRVSFIADVRISLAFCEHILIRKEPNIPVVNFQDL